MHRRMARRLLPAVLPMMVTGRFLAAVVAVLLTPICAAALDADGWMDDGNALYLSVGFGLRTITNDPADAHFALVNPGVTMEKWYSNFSADAGVFFVNAISMGLRYEHLYGKSYTLKPSFFGGDVMDIQYETRLQEILVDLRAWMPPRHGFLVGVAGGLGSASLDGHGAWSASNAVCQVYVGGHFFGSDGNSWFTLVRAGYALRNFGTVDKGESGAPLDVVELDLSGWFVELNLGWTAIIKK